MGPFDYDSANGKSKPLAMNVKEYKVAEVYAFNQSYNFSATVVNSKYIMMYTHGNQELIVVREGVMSP